MRPEHRQQVGVRVLRGHGLDGPIIVPLRVEMIPAVDIHSLDRIVIEIRRIHRAIGEHVACSIGAVTFERIPEGTVDMVDGARGLMQMVRYSGKNQIRHETSS
jgi:hypothetical protein